MQGLEIGGGSTYGAMDTMDVAHEGGLSFEHLEELPAPPQDNNQVAAWYDTDLWIRAIIDLMKERDKKRKIEREAENHNKQKYYFKILREQPFIRGRRMQYTIDDQSRDICFRFHFFLLFIRLFFYL